MRLGLTCAALRRVGKGARHTADPEKRSTVAPCPRVGEWHERSVRRVGSIRAFTPVFAGYVRKCAPLPTLQVPNGITEGA